MSLAPLAADGKILVGTSGGEQGIRGFLAAYDPDTGKDCGGRTRCRRRESRAARRGRRAISGRPAARRSGSPATTTRRPTSPTGAPATAGRGWAISARATTSTRRPRSPWTWPRARSRGTSSTRRTNRGTGTRCRRRSSSTSGATAGRSRGSIDVARNGYLWFLERGTGPIKFVEGTPYVKHRRVPRASTRRPAGPTSIPARKPGTGKTARVLPVALGRQELAADRVQSADADDLHPGQREPVRDDGRPCRCSYTPGSRLHRRAQRRSSSAPGADHIGEVQAWNVDTGKRVWTHTYRQSSNWGPMLATGGGLVFSGGTSDRMFHAFDARPENCCGSFPPTPASSASRPSSRSTAASTSPCSRAGASTPAGCRAASMRSGPANSPRCRKAERSGSSRSATERRSPQRPWPSNDSPAVTKGGFQARQ